MGLQHNLLHVTLLVPGILKWLLDVWKICAPLPPPVTETVVNSKMSNNAHNNRKILSTGMWYHVVWYTGKDISEKCTTEHTKCHSRRDGWHLPFTHIYHTFQRNPLNTIKHQHLFKIFETVLYNSSQVTLCQWVFKMLLHGLWKIWVLLEQKGTNYEINDTLWKTKRINMACLKKCNEREDLRTLHQKQGLKPIGQKRSSHLYGPPSDRQ